MPETGSQRRAGHYNYFRDYDPAIGRYIESDPIGLEGGLNTYAYVDGSPLALADPRGELFMGAIDAGESFGASAAQYWADKAVQSGNPAYHIPGAMASLWTPDTSDATACTLTGAYGARVFGPFTTRGVPRFLAKYRQYVRLDSPHHNKGWEFDGSLVQTLRMLIRKRAGGK